VRAPGEPRRPRPGQQRGGANNEGGQVWVRVVSLVPQPAGAQPCDITDVQVRLGVGVVRCMHCLDDEADPPTAEEMASDALAMTADADTLLWTIRDWEKTKFVIPKSLKIEQGLPLGPEGCCGGWEWTLTLRLLQCRGC
jgi:hypothetical protein